MYKKTFWVDQIKDGTGQIIQAGTVFNQANMNNIELGVLEAQITQSVNAVANRLQADEAKEAVPLIMKNQSITTGINTISLPTPRNVPTYAVVPLKQTLSSAEFSITTQKNGFTVTATNADSGVTVTFVITGGVL